MESEAKEDRHPDRPLTVAQEKYLHKWSWGAFFGSWLWGLFNRTYIAILALVPVFGLVWIFVLGIKGKRWAWNNGGWQHFEDFIRSERRWGFLGALVMGLTVVGYFFTLMMIMVVVLKSTQTYQDSREFVAANEEVIELIGTPMRPSLRISGRFRSKQSTGYTKLTYHMHGPKGEVEVRALGVKINGKWRMAYLGFKHMETNQLKVFIKDYELLKLYRYIKDRRDIPAIDKSSGGAI